MPSQEFESIKGAGLSIETPDDMKLKSISVAGGSKRSSQDAGPCPRWGQTMTMIDHKR